jgi:hypothetical protein
MDNDFKYINNLNKFLPMVEKKWVYTDNCAKCNSEFGSLINRQHHCRCCGKSFCWNCCHNKIDFSLDLVEAPKEEKTYKKSFNNLFFGYNKSKLSNEDNTKVVCDNCYSKLWNFNKLEAYIRICEFLDLKNLMNVLSVSKVYRDSAIYWIYKIRKIQIKQDLSFNKWELGMLADLSKYYHQHDLWNKQYIKGFLYEKYQTTNNQTLSFESVLNGISNNKITECRHLNCYCECKKYLDIHDFIEILEYIVQLENKYQKIFWRNYSLRSNIKILIQKICQPNNLSIKRVLPVITLLLLKLLNVGQDIDIDFVHTVFDLLLFEQKKICYVLNDIELLKNNGHGNETSCINFVSCLEKYIEKKNINIKDELIKLKKLKDFTVNIFYYNNVSNINSKLPLIYYFDFDMEITEIDHTAIYKNNNNNNYALYVSAKVKYLTKEIKKKFLIKKIDDFSEYYVSNLVKIMKDKINNFSIKKGYLASTVPICDIMIISNNFVVIELPEDGIFVSDLYSRKLSLKDYICLTASNKTVKKMMNNYISSLSFLCAFNFVLNLQIKDQFSMMVNKKEQIFFVNFNKQNENSSFGITNIMREILGPKNSSYFEYFTTRTIEIYDFINLQINFINAYLKGSSVISENLYLEIKTKNDIKNIN